MLKININITAMTNITKFTNLFFNNAKKTYNGTIYTDKDGNEICKEFKFEISDIGKYIVIKLRYEEHLGWGNILGTKLAINDHELSEYEDDYLYGVYKIDWHNEYQKNNKNISYKIKLVPVNDWGAWCPNRSWYTSDMESIINITYNLFEETPIFDNLDEANKFALKKNNELYPKKLSWWGKLKNRFNI